MKTTFTLLFTLLSLTCFSQFNVTHDGVRSKTDSTKTYTVVNADGKNAGKLYDNAIKHIKKVYENPYGAIDSQIEGEYIRYDTRVPKFSFFKNGIKHYLDLVYRVELSFKDDKVKYDITSCEIKLSDGGVGFYFKRKNNLSWGIYDKKGRLKFPDVKTAIETHFNYAIESLEKELNEVKEANDEW